MRQGRKSAAQTKAPLKDRIKGSSVNKVGSASSVVKAKAIVLSDEIISGLSEKVKDFNEKNKSKKVTLNTLKAVFRRGSGAYSTSHRPGITRNGWAYARVNKFLEKKAGKKVKKAYIQDDDLLENGGITQKFNDKELLARYKKGESIGFTAIAHLKAKGLIARADGYKKKSSKYMEKGGELGQEVVCHNCSWHWNTTDSDEYDKYVCHKCGFDNTLFYSNNIMEKGGEVNADNPKIKNDMIHKSGKVGGLLVGKRHSEGGIKAVNKSNNSPLEMEGGEVVITRNAVSDDTKREFEGEMLTNRQILSKINEGGGGVSFADGGDIPEHIMVSGKEYKYGGNTMKDNEIVDYCGCKHKMADGGDLKLFGIQHYDLKPSEAFEKIFGHKYKKGGSVESIVIINKSVPSYSDFKNNNKNTNLHISKSEYKKYLKNNYKVDFDLLPHRIQMALFLGNQKLVDNYINS